MKKAFYLKINRNREYAITNLSRWVDVSYLMEADCIIVCDDKSLEKRIKKELYIYREIEFIKSMKFDREIEDLVVCTTSANWRNAGCAHMTTLKHAENKYDYFWNIDADDTRFCVSVNRKVEILKTIERIVQNRHIDCISLDMWRSITASNHWSFGVTFLNGAIKWMDLCRRWYKDNWIDNVESDGEKNIDWYFTYLKKQTDKKIETFYVENLKFIHYADDFFKKALEAGLYHWKNGKLVLPIIETGYGFQNEGSYLIARDALKIDIGLTDTEAVAVFSLYLRDGKIKEDDYDIERSVNWDICKKKFEILKRRYKISQRDDRSVIGFCAGNVLKKTINKIKRICEIHKIVDNNSMKWGRKVDDDVVCISPEEINASENTLVVIFSYRRLPEIEKQIEGMHLKHLYVDEMLRCIE